jgi:hypothetical protein
LIATTTTIVLVYVVVFVLLAVFPAADTAVRVTAYVFMSAGLLVIAGWIMRRRTPRDR